MKTQIFIIGLILGIVLVAGCSQQQIIGGDKDEHGCLIAAGYSWCEEKQKCLRTWEENCSSQLLGGDRDEYGCIGSAGYSWNATIGACVREWELDEGQRQAVQTAVAFLSYRVTVVEVEVLRCPGCFIVHLQRNDNQNLFDIKLVNWTISQEPVACTEEVKICSDGETVVTRNPELNCEFNPCPEEGGVGLPNPASVYCREQGGTLKMVETDGGTQGICILKDGTECDEWAYFRGECPKK